MAELTIGEVAERAGISASAMRYYEAEGLLPKPSRRSGRRVYHPGIFDRLALIELGKRAGFTIAEIRRLLSGFSRGTPPGRRWRALAEAKLEEQERRIAEARRMKGVLRALLQCRCPTLEDCAAVLRRKRP